MSAKLRAFVASELPGELLSALEQVQTDLRQRGVRARWVRAGSIHLTLKFLGNIPAEQVTAVAEAMQAAAGRYSLLHLKAAGIGVFPGLRRPRVLWVGLSGETTGLTDLQQDLDRGLSTLGFAKEERGFRAHLTIGRFSERESVLTAEMLASYAARTFGEFVVRELVLFQSDLQPAGPVHTALARAQLKEKP
jgi:RNA 2',3'-cyclic 3'-phosphodiesterase